MTTANFSYKSAGAIDTGTDADGFDFSIVAWEFYLTVETRFETANNYYCP